MGWSGALIALTVTGAGLTTVYQVYLEQHPELYQLVRACEAVKIGLDTVARARISA
jgi:hypothetical protein